MNSQSTLWVPLINDDRVTCADSACDGKLRWLQGGDFQNQRQDFLEISDKVCTVMSQADGKLASASCRDRAMVICELDCQGVLNFGRWKQSAV